MTAMKKTSPARSSKLRLTAFAALGLAALGFGFAAWQGLAGGIALPQVAQACQASRPVAERMVPHATGPLAALQVEQAPKPAPEIQFQGPDGTPMTLASLKGKVTVVNLWATWCAPCREEMPALDKLQAELGGTDFEVVAINVDTRNPEKAKAWLQENKIHRLAYYADSSGRVLQTLQRSGHVVGLPVTLVLDQAGCEVAVLKGPADWASPEALALARAALGRGS